MAKRSDKRQRGKPQILVTVSAKRGDPVATCPECGDVVLWESDVAQALADPEVGCIYLVCRRQCALGVATIDRSGDRVALIVGLVNSYV